MVKWKSKKMRTNLKWSNTSKLKKEGIVSFSIPAYKSKKLNFITCPNSGYCKSLCYALQGRYLFKNVINAREYNLKVSLQANFVNLAIKDLKRLKAKYIRLHDSGDFYSQKYLNNWFKIASNFPDKIFYAYTKSNNLDFSNLPSNFKIIFSYGSKSDNKIDTSKPHALIFKSKEQLEQANYIDCTNSDLLAINSVKIGLIYHGSKKLNDTTSKILNERK